MTAAAPAWATVSGISFGPWQTPERKTPAVGDSTGRSFGCASVRKLLLSMLAVSMVASFLTEGSGSMAVARTTISAFIEDLLIVQKINALNEKLSIGLRNDFSYLTFDVVYMVLFHGSSVELIEVFPRGTNVDIEDSHVYIRIFITDQHRMLCSVHTADLGAVALSSGSLHNGFPRTG